MENDTGNEEDALCDVVTFLLYFRSATNIEWNEG